MEVVVLVVNLLDLWYVFVVVAAAVHFPLAGHSLGRGVCG